MRKKEVRTSWDRADDAGGVMHVKENNEVMPSMDR